MQRGWVIIYASHQLKTHERNYPTHHLELEVVVFAVKICRHYVYGMHYDIYMDHRILKYIMTQQNPSSH